MRHQLGPDGPRGPEQFRLSYTFSLFFASFVHSWASAIFLSFGRPALLLKPHTLLDFLFCPQTCHLLTYTAHDGFLSASFIFPACLLLISPVHGSMTIEGMDRDCSGGGRRKAHASGRLQLPLSESACQRPRRPGIPPNDMSLSGLATVIILLATATVVRGMPVLRKRQSEQTIEEGEAEKQVSSTVPLPHRTRDQS